MQRRTVGRQHLGATEAAVIITIVVTAGFLIFMSPGFSATPPGHFLAMIAAAALTGVITVRLATIGMIGPMRAAVARILALTPPPARNSPEAGE
jgi:hypothetical protein